MNALLALVTGRHVLGHNGCWLWTGGLNHYGYGYIYVAKKHRQALGAGRQMPAHRASYIARRGAIPEGLHVLHRCDRPRCVNPDHLFLGTPGDNTKDKVSKGRQTRGEAIAGAKLTREAVQAIRAAKGLPHGVLAAKYGVSKSTISYLLSGHTWRHV